MGSSGERKVEIFFLPFLVGGHHIPMVDAARVFAALGAKATIITTPGNAQLFQGTIQRDQQLGRDINFHTFEIASEETSDENFRSISAADAGFKLFFAAMKLQDPIEQFLRQRLPDCLISDATVLWAGDICDRVGIPWIMLHTSGLFGRCCQDSLERHAPHEKVGSDLDPFALPGLPHHVEFTRSVIPSWLTGQIQHGDGYLQHLRAMAKSELQCYGVLFNTFHGLQPGYGQYFKTVMGQKKVRLVGPLYLFHRNVSKDEEKHNHLKWLDAKEPNSVLYINFGSEPHMAPQQFQELALGLEASGHPFIWVVRTLISDSGTPDGESEEDGGLLPEGFEERVEKSGQGLIIRGWASQIRLLEHAAIGGFMTHNGWNSTMEGASAGVPMITWPHSWEQFYNESLVVDVLKIGIRVGNKEWRLHHEKPRVSVSRGMVEMAVRRLMGGGDDGEEMVEMRERAKVLSEKAKEAVDVGGSSYTDAIALIEELKSLRNN